MKRRNKKPLQLWFDDDVMEALERAGSDSGIASKVGWGQSAVISALKLQGYLPNKGSPPPR